MNWKPQPNVTGQFTIGNEYSLSGLSFDPGREARSASYEEDWEQCKKAEEEKEEEKRRNSRRDTDFAVSIALLGAMGG